MGTRNLTMVINQEGETKIAQYGQWDGYPDGQGATALKFLKGEGNIKKLKNALTKTRFLGEKDKEFLEAYYKNAPQWSNETDKRTDEQKRWFATYMTRDLGAEILENISNSEDPEILIRDNSEFGKDTISCEWVYIIDLKKNKLIVHNDLTTPALKEFDLSELPTEEVFIEAFQEKEDDEA